MPVFTGNKDSIQIRNKSIRLDPRIPVKKKKDFLLHVIKFPLLYPCLPRL